MSEHDHLFERLSDLVGVAAGYHDAYGKPVSTSIDARRTIVTALGFPNTTEDEARESLARVERLRRGLVPPVVVVEAGRPARIPVRGVDAAAASWRLTAENGMTKDGRGPIARSDADRILTLPRLPLGYYRLTVEAGGQRGETTVIAAPAQCWTSADIAEGARYWGLAAQLYGLRSAHNLGIGTYRDAGDAAKEAGSLGAAFVGLSPVHALFGSDRTKISPYSPSSRLFLETLHIDPTSVPGFAGSEAARLYEASAERIAALRHATFVEHAGVSDVLRPILDALWADFRQRGPSSRFDTFRRERGEALEDHAAFDALSEFFRDKGAAWIGEWPEPFRDHHSPEVGRFRKEEAERVSFHAWMQWIADTQLEDASQCARSAGMPIGLYRDLAVGADRGGSEVWSAPERFGETLSIGAPPDILAPNGQDWGLPPFHPVVLEQGGLAAFRALVSANMRHAGAIRIDHAFQLQRLFLVPVGSSATYGAYVQYPFEALLAVLRLESHRARCLVIAEDLGTAPAGFSDAIMSSGVLSYRVLSFERESDGGFKRPAAYPRNALSVITTHDLPTFAGWWRGLDTDLRQTLGIYSRERADSERAERVTERQRLAEALFEEKLLASPEPPEAAPFEAVVRYLARTPCSLNAIQYEDVVEELSQANMPGISEGHPNWRRKLNLDLEAIAAPGGPLAKTAAALATEGRSPKPRVNALAAPPPRATYRLQFHKEFTFDDAIAIVPYLARLGVSHAYASPIHTARPGSTHGYDIVDHSAINPELGGEAGFYRLSDALREHGLGLVLDIVPNHMGVGGSDNPWWLSALEWGELSPAAQYFDIDWERIGANRKLVVPFLGDRYGEALEKGNLKLAFDAAEGSFSVWHYEHRFPICPLSYPIILDRALAALGEIGTEGSAQVLAASERLRTMNEETAPERRAGFPEEGEALKRRIAGAVAASPGLKVAIERAVTMINGTAGLAESYGTLHRILEGQSYRLAHWRVAANDINYRRFFDINGLAGLRIEQPEVFARTHETIFRLVREGRIQGLRIDHIDGLADPTGYARALQSTIGPGFYVIVEKILEPGEPLRPWPVAGTTGYDALNVIDGVFVDTENEATFEKLYRDATAIEGRYGALLRSAKTEILETSFASELEVLTSDLKRIADSDRLTRDFAVNALRRALVEIIARFPVYRSYIDDSGVEPEDIALIEDTVEKAKRRSALPDRSVHDFVRDALLGHIETEGPGRPDPELVRRFRRRFQQLTGPVMAKSLEDTLFYRYVRLLALNEVGGDPGHFGLTADAFHDAVAESARAWPHAMIATATHDTKRGEDARARLLALSEMPDNWADAFRRFQGLIAPHLAALEEGEAPDANDQYMLLQTILGAWPHELLDGETDGIEGFRERITEYARKALREAKRHSSWVNVNDAYEDATFGVIGAVLQPGSAFLGEFAPLARRLAYLGMLTGLARTALKCTLPGVPDVYQGTELWDLSLVDPDNRRPVDYAARARALESNAEPGEALGNWRDGGIKQQVIARLLADRAQAPAFYAEADYRPMQAMGPRAEQIIAFQRADGESRLMVAVPRLIANLVQEGTPPVGREFWDDTMLPLPTGRWRDVVTGSEITAEGGSVSAGELFSVLPISVLREVQ